MGEGVLIALLQKPKDLVSGLDLVGQLQGDHHQGNLMLLLQHFLEGNRVKVNIELCCRGDVTSTNGPSHDHYFLYFSLDFGELPEQQAQVGQGAGVSPHQFVWAGHQYVPDGLEVVLHHWGAGRGWQLHAPESSRTMHMLGQMQLALNQHFGPTHDYHIFSVYIKEHIQGILCGVKDVGIAGRGGNTQQVDPGSAGRQDDGEGVIEAGVTVQPHVNLLILHCYKYPQMQIMYN